MATVVHPRFDRKSFVGMQLDAGWRLAAEFICSEAVVIPPDGADASYAQGELHLALRSWQARTGDGGLVLQDVFVEFGEQFLAPDIARWQEDRTPQVAAGAVRMVPDLVIEVLSPSTRANDLGIKREIYLDSGVGELWLVDPPARTVTRVRPDTRDQTLDRSVELTSSELPGFSLALGSIFRS